MEYTGINSVRSFGAKGDGRTDDSAAIQRAIDAFGSAGGTLFFPPGRYVCADIQVKPHVALTAAPTWSYSGDDRFGATVLLLAREDAVCLLDITDAVGATIEGLALDGRQLGRNGHEVHGISMIRKGSDYGRVENTVRVERCLVSDFSGDALHLDHVWCVTVSRNMLSGCRHGIYVNGWDLFILHNWLSGNRECGYYGYPGVNKGVQLAGNRIEWNGTCGISGQGGEHLHITGNQMDRSGAEGIRIEGFKRVTIVGNTFFRCGKSTTEEQRNTNLALLNGRGAVVSGNDFGAYCDDDGVSSRLSPDYDMVIGRLRHSVISHNVLYQAAVKAPILDLGGHDNLQMTANPQCLATDDF